MAVPKIFCLAFSGKPDSRWSWFVCACAAISQAMTMGVLFSFGVLFPVFMDYFQETREKTAWVGSLGVALVFFFGPLSGSLINRFGCRITTLMGGIVCVLSLMTASVADSLPVLFITYSVLYGLGSSFVFASSWIVVSKYFHKRRSLALGLVGGGQGLGVMAQGPLLQFLLDNTDWRGAFRIMTGVVSSICLVALAYAPIKDTNSEPANEVEDGSSPEAESARAKDVQGKFSLDFSVCKVPVVVAVAMSAGLQHFGRLTPQIHLVKHCATLGMSADRASTLFIYLGLASILGRITSGFVCDHRRVNSLYVYQTAVLMQGISTLLSVLAKSYVPLAVYAFVFGLCDGAFITTLNICLLKSVDSPRRASVIALHHPVISIFLASGAPVSGLIADKTGSYVPAFLMAGGVIVVASTIPFVLLSPCLRRSAFRVEDQGGTREELGTGEQPAVPGADNGGFIEDEESGGDKDDAQGNITSNTIVVKDITLPENKQDTQVDVHNVSSSESLSVPVDFTNQKPDNSTPGQGEQLDLHYISHTQESGQIHAESARDDHPKPDPDPATASAVNEGFLDDENEESERDCSPLTAISNDEAFHTTNEDPANEPYETVCSPFTLQEEDIGSADTTEPKFAGNLVDQLEKQAVQEDPCDEPHILRESNSNSEIEEPMHEAMSDPGLSILKLVDFKVVSTNSDKVGNTTGSVSKNHEPDVLQESNSNTQTGPPVGEAVSDSEDCVSDTRF